MLVGTAATALVAVGGAMLLHPRSRDVLLGDVDQDWLANELHFDAIASDDQTLILKDGSYVRVFALQGASYDTMGWEQEVGLASLRKDVFHQNVTQGLSMRLLGIKRLKDVSFDAEWPSPTLKELGDKEKEIYQRAYSITWYVILNSADFKQLHKATTNMRTGLGHYKVRQVVAAQDDAPCELTRVVHYLVTGELRDDLSRCSANMSANVPLCDLTCERNGLITTHLPTPYYSRLIGVRLWPEQINGFLVSSILALQGEIEVFQACLPLHNETALALNTRKIREQEGNPFATESRLIELYQERDDLTNNSNTIYESQFQIAVRARSEAELDRIVEEISVILNRARVSYSVETTSAAVGWFNRMPGRDKLVRPLRLYDATIAALWPFQFSPEGMITSPIGDRPVRLFRTPTGQNYAFQFHVSDKPQSAGNYIVFAPTGSGKSTLIMHLLSGIAKFPGVRNYVFDSKEGARFMTEVLGGVYLGYDQLSLNPLDTDLDDKASRLRASLILKAMVGQAYTDDMEAQIQSALTMAARMKAPKRRTLNDIYTEAFPARSPIKQAFAKWVTDVNGRDGQFSHVFNAEKDRIRGFLEASHLVGINMNEALQDPDLGPAVVGHIGTAIAEAARLNQSGFSIFVDEAANLLQNTGFRSLINEMFREYRKLNGIVGLAFQDTKALYNFDDAPAIIDNAPTLFFFPNAKADVETLKPFNLSEDQIVFIKGQKNIGAGRHVLVVKRDMAVGIDESAIIDVDLAPYEECLRFFRAGESANAHLSELKAKWGENQWLHHV